MDNKISNGKKGRPPGAKNKKNAKKTGRKPIWTPAKLLKLAKEHAFGCVTHHQFYTKIGLTKSIFYSSLNDPRFKDFSTIIKKEIDSTREPCLNDMAEAMIYSAIQCGLPYKGKDGTLKMPTKDARSLALTASIFVKKTIGGWREREAPPEIIKVTRIGGKEPEILKIEPAPKIEDDGE